jgi:hypothetical protein
MIRIPSTKKVFSLLTLLLFSAIDLIYSSNLFAQLEEGVLTSDSPTQTVNPNMPSGQTKTQVSENIDETSVSSVPNTERTEDNSFVPSIQISEDRSVAFPTDI